MLQLETELGWEQLSTVPLRLIVKEVYALKHNPAFTTNTTKEAK